MRKSGFKKKVNLCDPLDDYLGHTTINKKIGSL